MDITNQKHIQRQKNREKEHDKIRKYFNTDNRNSNNLVLITNSNDIRRDAN